MERPQWPRRGLRAQQTAGPYRTYKAAHVRSGLENLGPRSSGRPELSSKDPQLVMAADRTMMAMERTYAAWVRTGLAALASGVAARTLVSPAVTSVVADVMASLLIAFSTFCFVAGVWRNGRHPAAAAASDLRRVPRSVLIGANGIMVLISLSALVGLWRTG